VSDLPPLVTLGLLLVRPGFLFLAAPLFGGAYAPTLLKIGLMVIVGASLIPVVPVPALTGPESLALVVVREALVGLSLGFAIRVLVGGVEFAGHLTGFQLGFTYASLVDPQSGVRNGVLSALYGSMALVVFFAINAHHDLLRALTRSFDALPLGVGGVDGGLGRLVMDLMGMLFLVAAQLAAPVVIVLLIVELALGLLSRAAPTLNLMAQGFPIRLLVGLLALASVVQILPHVMAGMVARAITLGVRTASIFQ
jgi:flagellar biosynthetic protein FliR